MEVINRDRRDMTKPKSKKVSYTKDFTDPYQGIALAVLRQAKEDCYRRSFPYNIGPYGEMWKDYVKEHDFTPDSPRIVNPDTVLATAVWVGSWMADNVATRKKKRKGATKIYLTKDLTYSPSSYNIKYQW